MREPVKRLTNTQPKHFTANRSIVNNIDDWLLADGLPCHLMMSSKDTNTLLITQ